MDLAPRVPTWCREGLRLLTNNQRQPGYCVWPRWLGASFGDAIDGKALMLIIHFRRQDRLRRVAQVLPWFDTLASFSRGKTGGVSFVMVLLRRMHRLHTCALNSEYV